MDGWEKKGQGMKTPTPREILEEISERYNLENLNTLLVDDIKKLTEADHDIFKIMRKLIKE